MTFIQKISLFQYKNYSATQFNTNGKIICICGKNGSGKTNILDAIYTLCYTKSYFLSSFAPIPLSGAQGFRIEGEFIEQDETFNVVCKFINNKKELSINKVIYDRLTKHIGRFTAVMIAPDDIEIINQGSELRRKFMDSILSQCYPNYLKALLQYQKVLQQRNGWLKMRFNNLVNDMSLLDLYDQLLVQSATIIRTQRVQFISEFEPLLLKHYAIISNSNEDLIIKYKSDLDNLSLQELLNQNLQLDIKSQRTLKGIHKDDIILYFKNMLIKDYASQGQKKSVLLALKLAQYDYIKLKLNQTPILLLDDIFERLDQNRMDAIIKIITQENFGQVFLTDTHKNRFLEAFRDLSNLKLITTE